MIAHKRIKAICVVVLSALVAVGTAVPCFATSLSDATITYSVSGYYSQFLSSPSYTSGYSIDADGVISSASSSMYLTDYISVTEGGTIGFFYSGSIVYGVNNLCCYDSSYNVVEGGFTSSYHRIFNIPDGVSYVRFSQGYSSTLKVLNSFETFTATDYEYLFTSFDDITIDDDGIVTIPYQTYGYDGIYLDFQFYDSGFKTAQMISFDFNAYYSTHYDSSLEGSSVSFSDDDTSKYAYLNSYYISNGETVQYTSGENSTNSNPASIYCYTGGRYSGFIFTFPVVPASVSTAISIQFSNFAIDGVDTSVSLTLGDAGDDLLDLADNLAVPTPAIDVDSIVDDALSDADMDSVGDVWSFMSNDLITKMLLIVVSFALLGYILYGKKEAGN